jgi:thiol-disulfide isomerase/thioredoxin
MRALAVILAAGFALAAGCGGPPTPSLIPAESSRAVELEFDLLSGGRWASREAAGRIVVIDTWATWCKPCKKAFPKLNRLMVEHPEIVVIGVSVDEDRAAIDAFLREVPASFAIAHDPEITIGRPPLSFTQVPSLVVLDREGRMRVRAEDVNEGDYDKLSGWISALQ